MEKNDNNIVQAVTVQRYKAAAIIKRTDWDENPQLAVQSVIRNHEHFSELHFVDAVWNVDCIDYKGWHEQDLPALKKFHIKVVVHSKLDPNKIGASLVVELSPYCQVMPGGMNTLMDQVRESITENQSLTHFAVEAGTYIPTNVGLWKKHPMMIPDAFTSYGFFIALFVFDFIRRYWLNFGHMLYSRWGRKYALTTDVRARLVYKTFGRHRFAEHSIFWTLINPAHHPIEYGGRAVLNAPDVTNQGWRFVLWYFRLHRFLTIGLWIVPFVLYYWLLAYPWWNAFFGSAQTRFLQLLIRPVDYQIFVAWWIAQSLYAMSVCNRYLDIPFQNLLCCLQPFYIALLPVVLVYAQFHRSRSGWKISEK